MEFPIQVLIVDDSPVSRDLLAFIIESDPLLKVMGYAEDGEQALEFLKTHKPDVIMMDIVMPKMDGFEATRRIMAASPTPIIVVSGIYNQGEVSRSFQAMEAGAIAILEKPKGIGDAKYKDTARFVIDTIKAMSVVKLAKYKQAQRGFVFREEKSSSSLKQAFPYVEAIGIGASLGGPQALCSILSKLSPDFRLPIFIVQRISSGLIRGLVDWLKDVSPLEIKIPENGEQAKAGTAYIAPENYFMEIQKDNIISLTEIYETTEEEIPLISRLFRSLAKTYGSKSVGILLTGTGSDGARDLLLMKEKGALTIAQDPESSLVFDLPKQAIDLDAAKRIESLDQIVYTLKELS